MKQHFSIVQKPTNAAAPSPVLPNISGKITSEIRESVWKFWKIDLLGYTDRQFSRKVQFFRENSSKSAQVFWHKKVTEWPVIFTRHFQPPKFWFDQIQLSNLKIWRKKWTTFWWPSNCKILKWLEMRSEEVSNYINGL